MNFQTYHSKLEDLIPTLNELHREFLRVVPLDDGYFLICELEVPSFEFDVRLTDSTYEAIKLLDGIPPKVMHEYSGLTLAIQSWIEQGDTEFPIPVNKEEIEKFVNINTPVEDLEPESPLSEYTI